MEIQLPQTFGTYKLRAECKAIALRYISHVRRHERKICQAILSYVFAFPEECPTGAADLVQKAFEDTNHPARTFHPIHNDVVRPDNQALIERLLDSMKLKR